MRNQSFCVLYLENIKYCAAFGRPVCHLTDFFFNVTESCLTFLQLKNVDFEGLFGNISSVIDLSQRLFDALQETDYIG